MEKSYHQLAALVSKFPDVRVLCLGDVMLDRYVYGGVTRISAESPVPVLRQENDKVMLGAVGNVARNVAALGGNATIVAMVGDDDGGREIARLISDEVNLASGLVTVSDRRTTLKTRYVARGQQLLRADMEDTFDLKPEQQQRIIDAVKSALHGADVVVLSDYSKGCLGDRVLRAAIDASREAGKPIIVDPKGDDYTRYEGANLLKPNASELRAATGVECCDDDSAAKSVRKALETAGVGALLVTRSEHGMTLVERDGEARHFPAKVREVFDVSGAGDTALAVLALAVGAGATLPEATELANRACGIVVSKVGTAVVHAGELKADLRSTQFDTAEAMVLSLAETLDRVEQWRAKGHRVGFTNGCFDLIHAGHVSLLAQAKASCDRLVVGLNSDASVKRLKGENRPVNSEAARAIVLASLGDVDAVVVFDEDTPMRLIEAIRPDVLIKGSDYAEDEVVGATFVKSYGGQVFLAKLSPEQSTTNTIRKIKG